MRPLRTTVLATVAALGACATVQQVLALRNVDFTVDRVANVRLAGVPLDRVRSFSDVGLVDAGRIAAAAARGDLRLDLDLHLTAENPADNSVDARLVRMDWTLLLQGRETVSGVFADETLLRRGEPTDVPIAMSLNLIDFFEGSAQDLVELALSLTGQGGAPKEVTLRATPVVDTALGPIRYPRPITIVSREVGG
jgi:hypothetical protein